MPQKFHMPPNAFNFLKWALFSLAWPGAGLAIGYQTLTNESGQVIEVKLKSLDGEQVVIEPKGDYRSYPYPLAQLDSDSRQLVEAYFADASEKLRVDTPEADTGSLEEAGSETSSRQREKLKIDLVDNYEDWGLEPRHQGNRGTCSVFAVTHLLDYTLASAGMDAEISPEFLNWAADQAAGHRQDGAFFHHILEGLATYGFVMETDRGYRQQYRPNWNPSNRLLERAAKNREWLLSTRSYKVHWIREPGVEQGMSATHLDQIIAALEQGYPVAIGGTHSICLLGYEGRGGDDDKGLFTAVDSAPGDFRKINHHYMTNEAIEAFYIELGSDASLSLVAE